MAAPAESVAAYEPLQKDSPLALPESLNMMSSAWKNTFYCTDNTIIEFEIIDSKNSSTAYLIVYELVDVWVLEFDHSHGTGASSPSYEHWSRKKRRNLWVGRCVSCWWPLFPITVYRTVFGSARFLCWMPLSVFFGSSIVSCNFSRLMDSK